MRIEDLDYDLPEHLIAQEPCLERDQSRLLVVERGGGVRGHHQFRDLVDFLAAGDLLVLNDTRVLPARLIGRRAQTGGKWEGLFLREPTPGSWELLCQTRGRPIEGEAIVVDPPSGEGAPLTLVLTGRTAEGRWLARPESTSGVQDLLTRYGRVPLPPYIRKGLAREPDRERYQTVYAKPAGAIAAPTAGLHFTPALFETLWQRGVAWSFVTLHVGPGTFQPIQVEELTEHKVEAEWAEIPAETARAIDACKERGGRVVAAGTTTTRVLETAGWEGKVRAWSGYTDLTIVPPFRFQVVDGLVTNFHLPRSSLLLLVAAFTGLESMRKAYHEAVSHSYRFYSYGDAMLIL